ncbi:RNA polymerase sigma factor [Peristeroidobacter agariperforans]|uniref:RNA polymerase sigma factor n=1 Tax=Peristeroidobacter agariperforans TaxID=268404 RepID=UPI00101C33F9|nr:sigma-70 family RNA polymerase sigma factor [Peristeroidobacter agariperforans]
MKLNVVGARAPVTVATPAAPKRSFTSSWEAVVRRWLWGRSSTNLGDVSQEVFIRFSGYTDETLMRCPQTFVLKVAANVVDEWCGVPGNEWLEDEEELTGKQSSAAQKGKGKSVSKAVAKQLQAAVDRLPLRQRQVLLMHVNEGLTYEQIAQRVRMSPGIVRRELVRAYAKVRCEIGEKGIGILS